MNTTAFDYEQLSYGGDDELSADINEILYQQQLHFDPSTDFKLDPEQMQDLSEEERKYLGDGHEVQFDDPNDEHEQLIRLKEEIIKKFESQDEDLMKQHLDTWASKELTQKEKLTKIFRFNAKLNLGERATEKEISQEIIRMATEAKSNLEKVFVDLTDKELELVDAIETNSPNMFRLFSECLPGLLSKFPGDQRLSKKVRHVFDMEKELVQLVDTDKAILQQQIKNAFVSKASGEKMWQLHKENPDFYTGERLGSLFGVSRNRAWAELIMREHMETEPGKFNYDKVAEIFKEERKAPTDTKMSNQFKNEEEAYKDYLNIQKKTNYQFSPDEKLSDFAKRPFQPFKEIEKEPQIQILQKDENAAKTEQARTKVIFADIGRGKTDENREFRVRQKDGTLRTASWTEQSFLGRKRTFPKVKMGHGGRTKRQKNRRKRQF